MGKDNSSTSSGSSSAKARCVFDFDGVLCRKRVGGFFNGDTATRGSILLAGFFPDAGTTAILDEGAGLCAGCFKGDLVVTVDVLGIRCSGIFVSALVRRTGDPSTFLSGDLGKRC
jgi:hypothetical protein